MLRAHFGWRPAFPVWELPKYLIRIAAPVGGLTRSYVDRNVGFPLCFDNSRTRAELGIEFRPAEESIVEHFQQMIDDGLA